MAPHLVLCRGRQAGVKKGKLSQPGYVVLGVIDELVHGRLEGRERVKASQVCRNSLDMSMLALDSPRRTCVRRPEVRTVILDWDGNTRKQLSFILNSSGWGCRSKSIPSTARQPNLRRRQLLTLQFGGGEREKKQSRPTCARYRSSPQPTRQASIC